MVHDGAKDIIYFNGVQVNEKNAAGALDKTKHPFGIGYDPIDNGSFFDGSLDDVAVLQPRPFGRGNCALCMHFKIKHRLFRAIWWPITNPTATPTMPRPYNNHASVQGAQLSTDRFGKSNQAYSFNGVNQSLVAPIRRSRIHRTRRLVFG
jgi:hypothetical protein